MKRTCLGLLLLAACGDDSDDVAVKPVNDSSVAVEAGRLDATVEAGSRAVDDAKTPIDSAAPTLDASEQTSDAGPPQTTRRRVCGDKTDWPSPLPASNARTATRVKDGFKFVEGPVWIAGSGVLLFSDMNMGGGNSEGPPAQIQRLQLPSSFSTFAASSGSNGLAVFDDASILAATHNTRSLSFFDVQSGARDDVAVTYGGKRLNSPNDLAIRDDGTVYFTDPSYQLGGRTSETKVAVYSVKLERGTRTASATLIDDSYRQPNGVVLSPDQKTLYVGSADADIFKYDVADDGSVRNKVSFAKPGGSDGLTVDCAGNLYVTSGAVEVFAPNGEPLGQIRVGDNPSNVAFGGPDRKTLYITAQGALYAIELNVPGFPY